MREVFVLWMVLQSNVDNPNNWFTWGSTFFNHETCESAAEDLQQNSAYGREWYVCQPQEWSPDDLKGLRR